MKIIEINENHILFDNGYKITFGHCPDCCEWNYADFEQLDDLARETEFEENLIFEIVEGIGFRFGDNKYNMFFIPCYSNQNGYYSNDIDIYFNGNLMLNFNTQVIEE